MGVLEAIFHALSIDADFENISIDSTSCKVHQSANGGGKTGNIDSQNAVYTIPPKSDVNDPWPVDWHTYKEGHLIECFFQKLK